MNSRIERVVTYCRDHPSKAIPAVDIMYNVRYSPENLLEAYPTIVDVFGGECLEEIISSLPVKARNVLNGQEIVFESKFKSGNDYWFNGVTIKDELSPLGIGHETCRFAHHKMWQLI